MTIIKMILAFKKFILTNVHTLALLLGVFFIAVAAFMFNMTIGFLILGIEMIILAILLERG